MFVITNLAAAVATCTVMIFTWLRYSKPDVSMTLNGRSGGLWWPSPPAVTLWTRLGRRRYGHRLRAGRSACCSREFFDQVCSRLTTLWVPSASIGVCGALGTILTGLFATGVSTEKGVFYGGGFHFFGVQCLGVASVILYVAVVITIVFAILKHTIGLRVTPEEEITGLDVSEHGLLTAYAGFAMLPDTAAVETDAPVAVTGSVPTAEAIPVKRVLLRHCRRHSPSSPRWRSSARNPSLRP
ncbi:MAG: hypothetical protein ACLSHO_13955 [Dysosmobacter sp.]